MQKGDRAAIENSIKMLGDQARNLRYDIRIKQEELKELTTQLKQTLASQKWRKEMIR